MVPINRATRATNQLRALWKWFLSYRKRDWELNDYPIVFRTQEIEPGEKNSRFKLHRHVASIVNWYATSGTGDSREDAFQDLRSTFAALKSNKREAGEQLPRPGTKAPLIFASQERVNTQSALAEDFTHRVLDLPWAWISDESSLWHFHSDETNDVYFARIKEIYGVDVSDIESARLSEILERIASAQRSE